MYPFLYTFKWGENVFKISSTSNTNCNQSINTKVNGEIHCEVTGKREFHSRLKTTLPQTAGILNTNI